MNMKLIVPALALAGLIAAGLRVATVARSSADHGVGAEVIQLPERAAAPAPAVPNAPALTEAANNVPPLTLTMATVREGPNRERRVTRQVITRTPDRVHLALDGGRTEWLFTRNPVDRTRVSGYLIDHASRQILVHDESELRSGQGFRGWADVWMMRFDPRTLDSLRATAEPMRLGNDRFTRYVPATGVQSGLLEAWWSDTLLMAAKLVVRQPDEVTTSTITSIDRAIEPSLLAEPRLRFPGYELVDPADAGDRRHER